MYHVSKIITQIDPSFVPFSADFYPSSVSMGQHYHFLLVVCHLWRSCEYLLGYVLRTSCNHGNFRILVCLRTKYSTGSFSEV